MGSSPRLALQGAENSQRQLLACVFFSRGVLEHCSPEQSTFHWGGGQQPTMPSGRQPLRSDRLLGSRVVSLKSRQPAWGEGRWLSGGSRLSCRERLVGHVCRGVHLSRPLADLMQTPRLRSGAARIGKHRPGPAGVHSKCGRGSQKPAPRATGGCQSPVQVSPDDRTHTAPGRASPRGR